MKKLIYLLIFLSVGMEIYAQEKQFTLEDLIPGGNTHSQFTPKTEYKVKWQGDDLIFFNEKETLIADPAHPDKKEILAAQKEEPVNKEWENVDYCAENKSRAYTLRNNLYLADNEGNSCVIAEDSNPYIVYGKAVHRNEFGIKKGTFWSPSGHYLAFYRMDETMVADYPLVDISAREAQLKNIKYPMAGMKSHEVTVGVYSLSSQKTIYLKTEEPKDRYLTNISWDANEKYIYIVELNREQNHLQVNQYSVETGEKTRTLFEESHDKYIEPQNPLLFLKHTPGQFIRQSQKDGYNHLYLYNIEGKLLKQLTSGKYDIKEVVGLDKEEKNIFVVTNELNPIEFQVYKIHLKSGKKTQLTFEPGVHRPQLSASGKYILDSYSNRTTPLNIDLIYTAAADKARIQRLQTAKNPYTDYSLPEITLGSLKAADGETDLYYRLVKPTRFDPAKKYPAIIYVYGGPHSQMVINSWMGAVRGWDLYMAQKGYVIFTIDNRGTSNRGFEFENVIHRQLGINETADQMKGVEFLQSLPYVNSYKIGVHGWSYGGFMTANLMLRHPDVFKAGVAGGPVIDWKYYEIMYGERYMDTPQENPEGYEESNMNNFAGNLKGRLLLIHGDEDPTVVWQNSLSFLKACIAAGTYPDYFVYPGQEHNMHGRDRVHLHEKITRYFEDYLK
jgi:dipeptidyl-peptidase-4